MADRSWRLVAFSFLLSAFSLLLSACSDPAPRINYQLTALLPSPATPGDTLTAYGTLPKNATVFLGDPPQAVPTSEVYGGLTFMLPAQLTAGELHLTLTDGKSAQLTATLQVIPRIDSAVLSGGAVKITGAGWPGNLNNPLTQVEIAGQKLSPTPESGSLVTPLPANLPYGATQVRVWVGNQVSNPYNLLREAGAVSGMVALPAALNIEGQSSKVFQPQPNPPQTTLGNVLVVYHGFAVLTSEIRAKLTGLQNQQSLQLGATLLTRLVFDSEANAEAAKMMLQPLLGLSIQHIDFDRLVSVGSTSGASIPLAAGDAPATPGEGQWHLPLMGLPKAWAKTRGEGVTVAVVDTGVLLSHPDLQANLLPGYDFVDNDATPMDTAGHGTHVAGLVAANGLALGAAPKARLLPVRVLSGTSGGSAFTVAQGILWAAGLLNDAGCTTVGPTCNPNPAQVINLSLGTPDFSQPMADAVSQAMQKGVIVVAAAGNDGSTALNYPAALPGVISVTALAGPLTAYQPYYASKGPGIQLTAYGGDTTQDQDGNGESDGILSTDLAPDGKPGYGLRMGTSMASPLAAGVAALALSSGTPPSLVRAALGNTATDLGVMGYDTKFGYGLVTGRVASTSSPKTYVVAMTQNSQQIQIKGWTLAQSDNSFVLSNLAPGETVQLIAASDANNNQMLGEAGELLSAAQTVGIQGGKVLALQNPLTLNPSDGSQAIDLRE